MTVSGLCELCGAGDVDDACDRCGNLVCDDHYDRPSGLCVACANELDGDPTVDEEYPDEVDEHRF